MAERTDFAAETEAVSARAVADHVLKALHSADLSPQVISGFDYQQLAQAVDGEFTSKWAKWAVENHSKAIAFIMCYKSAIKDPPGYLGLIASISSCADLYGRALRDVLGYTILALSDEQRLSAQSAIGEYVEAAVGDEALLPEKVVTFTKTFGPDAGQAAWIILTDYIWPLLPSDSIRNGRQPSGMETRLFLGLLHLVSALVPCLKKGHIKGELRSKLSIVVCNQELFPGCVVEKAKSVIRSLK